MAISKKVAQPIKALLALQREFIIMSLSHAKQKSRLSFSDKVTSLLSDLVSKSC